MLQTYKNFTPTVSIVMATYNRAAYLPRSIKSVLKQTCKEWELIIVDDGGTDGSCRIIIDSLERGAHIRYLRKEHAGPACARNMGIHCAQAPLITFIDSDDEYAPDHLSLRVEYLHAHPEIDLIHGGIQIIGDPLALR
jgi:glycosyltransferase involved in cell wall biosynthesis